MFGIFRRVCMPASTSLATPTLFPLLPSRPPVPPPESHSSPCELNFLLVLGRTSKLIVGSSLFLLLDDSPPFCARHSSFFVFFVHPVASGWKCSLINFKTHPISELRARGGIFSFFIYLYSGCFSAEATLIKGQSSQRLFLILLVVRVCHQSVENKVRQFLS